MRHRHPDEPIEYREDPHWKGDPDIQRYIDQRVTAATEDTDEEEEPWTRRELGRLERIYADLAVSTKLGKPLDPKLYVKAVNELRTRVHAPVINRPTADFITAWEQPEAVRLFARWNAEGKDCAAFQGSKAFMAWWAGGRHTPHMKYAHDSLIHNPALLEHFGRLARTTPYGRLLPPSETAMIVREYSICTRHKERLAEALIPIAQETLIEIARAADELCKDEELFDWAGADGDLIPAWARQKSAKRKGVLIPEIEARYRRRAKDAGARAYTYTSDGQEKQSQAIEGERAMKLSKFVRGYNDVMMCSLKAPFCLGLTLGDASKVYEPREMDRILPPIYKYWPDFPLQALVADKLWDVKELYEWLECRYGIHLVAIRKPSLAAVVTQVSEKMSGSVLRFTGEGIAYCRAHELPLFYERMEPADRSNLHPGQKSRVGAFRTRLRCAHPTNPCGRLSIPTFLNWAAFPHFPHHPHGRPYLYALRVAAQNQRNVIESQFSSQEISFKLGLEGADRTRVYNIRVYEALLLLAQITLGLQTLASLRMQRGVLLADQEILLAA